MANTGKQTGTDVPTGEATAASSAAAGGGATNTTSTQTNAGTTITDAGAGGAGGGAAAIPQGSTEEISLKEQQANQLPEGSARAGAATVDRPTALQQEIDARYAEMGGQSEPVRTMNEDGTERVEEGRRMYRQVLRGTRYETEEIPVSSESVSTSPVDRLIRE